LALATTPSLTSVNFEDGSALTSIGDYVFAGATALTSINIPASVNSVSANAFLDTPSLGSINYSGFIPTGWPWSAVANINVNGKKSCGTSGHFIISNKVVTDNYNCIGSVTIPEGVTSIGQHAFDVDYGGGPTRPNVTSLSISSTVTSIGSFAFRKSKLTELTIPNNFTSLLSNPAK
jgi:hypothetical protein